MNRNVLFFTFTILIACASFGFYFFQKQKPSEEIHYHAGFLVYIDGKLQDYTDPTYTLINPCTVGETKQKVDEQKEKAHLHIGAGDVVHVEALHAVWSDLFKNIGVTLPENIPVEVYIESSDSVADINSTILPYQSVIIVSGSKTGIDFSHFVTRQHIEEVEENTETC